MSSGKWLRPEVNREGEGREGEGKGEGGRREGREKGERGRGKGRKVVGKRERGGGEKGERGERNKPPLVVSTILLPQYPRNNTFDIFIQNITLGNISLDVVQNLTCIEHFYNIHTLSATIVYSQWNRYYIPSVTSNLCLSVEAQ